MNDDNMMFDTNVLEEQEIEFEQVVEEPVVSVATTTKSILVSDAEVVTTASASVEIPDEWTLAQTLVEIKTAKPKSVTTTVKTVTSARPRAKGIIFHDQEEQVPASTKTFSSSQSQLSQVKDKGKGKMVEPEVPLKKKDQVALDEEMTRNLEAQLQAELIEEERLVRQKEEKANIALIESWDNTQAMMEADFELAHRLQAEKQGEITIEERSRLFVELMNRRKKHFAKLRAEEIRRKPPTKAQKRNQMSIYLKNMAGYKHSQLKSKSYDEIQKLFDKEMKRVNTFVDMNSEVVKGSETRTEESSKRARDELESNMSKKQKIDEHVEVEEDDQEEAEMKRHIEIVKDDKVAIDAIPLATKPLVIVEYKIDKDRRMGYFKLIRAYRSSKRFRNLDIFMLVEKRYPLTAITISNMLNKKLQADRWNEMCYQLLKLMTKQEKGINNRVINLENTKTAQAQEITSLKLRVKKLKKKGGSRTYKLKRLYKGSKKNDTAQVNIVATTISTASTIPVSAASITDVEITLAQALAELKSAKPTTATSTRPKSKGLVIHEQEQAPTPIVSSQQPLQAKIQNKGKAKIIEPELVKKLSKKDQLKLDEEVAQRLQAEFDEQERIEREKVEANIDLKETWDDIQAKIKADQLLAKRLQAKEQEELTIEEMAILFQQLLEKKRKHFATKRAEEKRNRPPTKAQQRSIMCNYLKNMEGWKPKDLKSKSFSNIQELFDKEMKRVNTFVDYRTELVEESSKKAEAEIAQESSSKRAGDELEQESIKK
ncbi:hypothetical protein Tco_0906921 [Tanacetum coccineum]|uniref:Uncharacterized protein n=1 Tax=Tanacetum coccineum TaxID=301880 RepID=A0ABQ5CHT3_9ASTR